MAYFEAITSPWDDLFFSRVAESRDVIRFACPFIKRPVVELMLNRKSKDVQLRYINSFKLQYFYTGASDLEALQLIIDSGGLVTNYQRLHSKLYVFDDSHAVVTSANLTWGGLRRNHEYGVLVKDPSFISTVRSDFDDLFAISDAASKITHIELAKANDLLSLLAARDPLSTSARDLETAPADDELLAVESDIERGLAGWQRDIFSCLRRINSSTFTLTEVYAFESDLHEQHPDNSHIRDKIRQQLQYLRNLGLIEFTELGHYRKLWRRSKGPQFDIRELGR